MRRIDLEHMIRTAAVVADVDELIVVKTGFRFLCDPLSLCPSVRLTSRFLFSERRTELQETLEVPPLEDVASSERQLDITQVSTKENSENRYGDIALDSYEDVLVELAKRLRGYTMPKSKHLIVNQFPPIPPA